MWWFVQPWVRLGKGRGSSFSNDKERLALCLMRGALSSADSKWPLTRAVDTSQHSSGQKGFRAAGMEGGTSSFQGEEFHASPPHLPHPTLMNSTEGEDREPRSGGHQVHTLIVAQETGTQGQKKRLYSPRKNQALPRGAWGASPPAQRPGGRAARMGVRSISTHTRPGSPRSTGTGGSSPRG